jgi:pimeloyl-ACP methyl ester carboxylesterase
MYVEEVPGREPPVVLLHHGANSLRGWDPFVPEIAGGRRLVAYDRRGFGSSPRDAVFDAGLFDRDADDLAELLRERDATPAHLVGFSDGATVALVAAVRHPELVVSVTAIGNHIRLDRATHELLLDGGPELAPERHAEYRERHGEDWEQVFLSWYDLWTQRLADWDIEESLRVISAPVLVVHDRNDPLSPREHAEGVIRSIPHAKLSWYDTGRHGPHYVERERFDAELEAHLRAAESPSILLDL